MKQSSLHGRSFYYEHTHSLLGEKSKQLSHHLTDKKYIGMEEVLKESKLAEVQILQKFRLVNYNMKEDIQATESKQQ